MTTNILVGLKNPNFVGIKLLELFVLSKSFWDFHGWLGWKRGLFWHLKLLNRCSDQKVSEIWSPQQWPTKVLGSKNSALGRQSTKKNSKNWFLKKTELLHLPESGFGVPGWSTSKCSIPLCGTIQIKINLLVKPVVIILKYACWRFKMREDD